MRTTVSRMFLVLAAVVIICAAFVSILTSTSCASNSAVTWQTISTSNIVTNDPVVAEDMYFIVAKRVHDRREKVPSFLVDQFRESARETWLGLDKWQTSGDATDYRKRWPEMVTKAVVIEAAAKRNGGN